MHDRKAAAAGSMAWARQGVRVHRTTTCKDPPHGPPRHVKKGSSEPVLDNPGRTPAQRTHAYVRGL